MPSHSTSPRPYPFSSLTRLSLVRSLFLHRSKSTFSYGRWWCWEFLIEILSKETGLDQLLERNRLTFILKEFCTAMPYMHVQWLPHRSKSLLNGRLNFLKRHPRNNQKPQYICTQIWWIKSDIMRNNVSMWGRVNINDNFNNKDDC